MNTGTCLKGSEKDPSKCYQRQITNSEWFSLFSFIFQCTKLSALAIHFIKTKILTKTARFGSKSIYVPSEPAGPQWD